MPDPARELKLSEFAGKLRDLRILAGNPSYAELTRVDSRLARSTMSDALTGKAAPSLEFLLRFVAACDAFARKRGHPIEETAFATPAWRSAWNTLQRELSHRPGPPADRTVQQTRHPAAAPRQLPRDRGLFIGREVELADLDALLLPVDSAGGRPNLVLLDGAAGVGKTSLALRWAHSHAELFPDGQLFVDLRGFGPGPRRSPTATLHFLLRSLGADIATDDLDALAATFRSTTADRRMLLLLDNAADPDDIRPLLPGSQSTVVIATSRRRMTGLNVLDGARSISLSLLSGGDAMAVLQSGSRNSPLDESSLRAITVACGRLPLALRIAAERVSALPPAETIHAHTVLATSEMDDAAVSLRRVFSWSLEAVSTEAARLFSLIGLLPPGAFEAEAPAALIEATPSTTRALLSQLADLHLLDRVNDSRSDMHDLLRAYAQERSLEQFSPGELTEAKLRLCEWYDASAWAADAILLPARSRSRGAAAGPVSSHFDNYDAALAWCDDELTSLTEIAVTMCDLGRDDLACGFATSLLGFFNIRKPWSEWTALFTVATEAADRLGDPDVIGNTYNGLGIARRELCDDEQAIACFNRAAAAYEAAGDKRALSMVENNLGVLANERSRPRTAVAHYVRALELLEGSDDPWRAAIVAHNLAEAQLATGDVPEAEKHARQALDLSRSIGDASGESAALTTLALVTLRLGEPESAVSMLYQAAEGQLARGEVQGAAISQRRLGKTLIDLGRHSEGLVVLETALAAFTELGDPLADDVRRELSATVSP